MSKFRISSGRGGAVAAGGGVVAAPILTFVPVPSVPRVRCQWSPPVQQQHTWHWSSRWSQPPHTSHSCTLSGAYRGEGVITVLSSGEKSSSTSTKSECKHFHVIFAWFTLYVALKRVVVLIKIEFDCITAIYSQYSCADMYQTPICLLGIWLYRFPFTYVHLIDNTNSL